MKVFGIDFTSRPSRRKPITCATCELEGDVLTFISLETFATFTPFEDFLSSGGPWIAGLDFPTEGRVLFGGEDALGLDMRQRNIGLVFQNYALFRHMSVFDNVAFGLKVRPGSRRPPGRDGQA